MTHQLVVTAPAESDIAQASEWYEEKSKGLGLELLRAVDACLMSIRRNPLAYPKVHKDIRRALLRKFPFGTFYVVAGDQIVILACFHVRRGPGTLHRRF
jgi:toxin ParE1/3/4